jgi:linoleate 10R-lipoxygenase
MKRLSSVFKKKDKKESVNGTSEVDSPDREQKTSAGKSASRNTALTNGNKAPNNDPSDGPDHSINRDGIVTSIEKFGKVIHLAGRPLPSGTGDGSYQDDPKPSGSLWDDLKAMRVKDYQTLHMLLEKELNKESLTDDKTMVMERVIQVRRSHSSQFPINIIKLVANLPQNSENRVTLTNTFVGELWDSLGHPPNAMLGDKYTYRQADGS